MGCEVTRVSTDIETDNPKIAAQRSPADDKRRSWQKYRNALRGRRGAFNDLGPARSPGLKSDGVKQVRAAPPLRKSAPSGISRNAGGGATSNCSRNG